MHFSIYTCRVGRIKLTHSWSKDWNNHFCVNNWSLDISDCRYDSSVYFNEIEKTTSCKSKEFKGKVGRTSRHLRRNQLCETTFTISDFCSHGAERCICFSYYALLLVKITFLVNLFIVMITLCFQLIFPVHGSCY